MEQGERDRKEGGEHAPTGDSTYVHEAKAMVDTSELAFETLNQEGIVEVNAILFSHFRQNQTLGLRVRQ